MCRPSTRDDLLCAGLPRGMTYFVGLPRGMTYFVGLKSFREFEKRINQMKEHKIKVRQTQFGNIKVVWSRFWKFLQGDSWGALILTLVIAFVLIKLTTQQNPIQVFISF